MTKEQAIEKYKSGWWKTATDKEIVGFQLRLWRGVWG
jgi:hypothetical protein